MGTLPERSGTSGRSLAGQCGATLLYVIGAIVLLGGIAAALAVMSPSTTQSKLEQEAGDRAFYNAQSGLNFIYSMAAANSAKGNSLTAFLNAMGGNNALQSYALPDGGTFSYRLTLNTSNNNGGTYDVAYLLGTVGSGDIEKYAYLMFGGERGNGSTETYTPKDPEKKGSYTNIQILSNNTTIANQAILDGSVIVSKGSIGNEASIGGNVTSSGPLYIGNEVTIGGMVCANGDVTTSNGINVSGDIKSQGNVAIGASSSVVKKSIYAIGTVTLQNSCTVQGDVNAGSDVILNSASYVYGYLYTGGGLTLYNGSTVGTTASPKAAYVNTATSLGSASFIDGDLFGKTTLYLGSGSAVSGTTCVGGKITGDKRNITQCKNYSDSLVLAPTLPLACTILRAPKHAAASNFPASGDSQSAVNNTLVLKPGTYGNISLKNQYDALWLKSGIYHFVGMSMSGDHAKLYLDVSGGDITIFVTGDISMGNMFTVYISQDGTNYYTYDDIIGKTSSDADKNIPDKGIAAKSYLETLGSISFGNQNSWIGTLYAKNNINFGYMTHLLGAAFSSDGAVNFNSNIVSYYVESNYARDNWVEADPSTTSN